MNKKYMLKVLASLFLAIPIANAKPVTECDLIKEIIKADFTCKSDGEGHITEFVLSNIGDLKCNLEDNSIHCVKQNSDVIESDKKESEVEVPSVPKEEGVPELLEDDKEDSESEDDKDSISKEIFPDQPKEENDDNIYDEEDGSIFDPQAENKEAIEDSINDQETETATEEVSDYPEADLEKLKANSKLPLDYVLTNTTFDLISYDFSTGDFLIKKEETNLGDLVADAILFAANMVDRVNFSIFGGERIRENLRTGNITVNDVLTILPYDSPICVVQMSGRTILDALEMSARNYPYYNDGFLQTSELTYRINSSIKSHVVVDENGKFVKVDGQRRVENVLINGIPINPESVYKVAAESFIVRDNGDGYVFDDVTILHEDIGLPSDLLIEYIKTMDSIPNRYIFSLQRITTEDNDYYITINDFVLNSMNGYNEFIVRKNETNLANLVSDAVLYVSRVLEEDVDFALVNGGNIRGNLTEGKIDYYDVIATLPFSSLVSITEVSGQSILDALEMGVRLYPNVFGGFLHPSGLTYSIDPTIESSVVVDDSEPYNIFVEVAGKRRVHNVRVNGEPIDPKRTYKMAGSSFFTRYKGDGFVFPDTVVIRSDFALPSDLLADYLIRLERIPEEYRYPQGRVVFEKSSE